MAVSTDLCGQVSEPCVTAAPCGILGLSRLSFRDAVIMMKMPDLDEEHMRIISNESFRQRRLLLWNGGTNKPAFSVLHELAQRLDTTCTGKKKWLTWNFESTRMNESVTWRASVEVLPLERSFKSEWCRNKKAARNEAAVKALQELQYAIVSFEKKFEDPAVYIRWGHVLLAKKRWPKAKDAFLRSIHYRPTAEAWFGVGYAAYQAQELKDAYEALREAKLLDNERFDIWAQLCLVNLRLDTTELTEHCFRQCIKFEPQSEDVLLEISNECRARDVLPTISEAAARRALQLRDSWQGHASLAEAFAKRGEVEKAVLESQVAIRMGPDSSEQRKALLDRAMKWAEDLGDMSLVESVRATQPTSDLDAGA